MFKTAFAETPPDRAAMTSLLVDYYKVVIPRTPPEMRAKLDPHINAQDFWDEVTDYFPPNGRLLLVSDAQGALHGCAMMRKIRPDAAELKRMFLRKPAQGQGLGKVMVQMRMDAARDMGLGAVYADTLRKNTSMQAIYADLGFQQIPQYPESHTAAIYPFLQPEMLYYRRDL